MIKKRLEGPLGGILFYLIAFSFIAMMGYKSWADKNMPNTVVFHHPTYNFSFEHPSQWFVFEADEFGYRGNRDSRASIHRSHLYIDVQQRYATAPTVDQVILWGQEKIDADSKLLVDHHEPPYINVELKKEIVDGIEMGHGTYTIQEDVTRYDVYLARKNDMIIITLECDTLNCDLYFPDFEKLVASFTPKY